MLHTKKIHLRERPLKKLLTTETQNIFKNSLAYSIGFFFFKYISVKEGRNLQGRKNEFRWKGSRMKKKKKKNKGNKIRNHLFNYVSLIPLLIGKICFKYNCYWQ